MCNLISRIKPSLIICPLLTACMLFFMTGCYSVGNTISSDNGELAKTVLDLPEAYYLEADVISSSGFGSQKTTYALSRSDGWIYLKLGYDREQYVYKRISDGKYIEYKYSPEKGKYLPTMISEALQTQIDAGNVPLDSAATGQESVDAKIQTLDPYICAYRTLTSSLSYSCEETIDGTVCKKYTGTVNAVLTKSELEFWIDPSTGLAFRYINKTRTGLMTTQQKAEITEFSEKPRIPSVA